MASVGEGTLTTAGREYDYFCQIAGKVQSRDVSHLTYTLQALLKYLKRLEGGISIRLEAFPAAR
ncbi:MAG: hypothetical protein COB37_02070 [Kordiimonadales bacterium]|nr:MAG: hypothetical protein COB37_02070 [Kordiimonadales bacterium]